MTVSAPAPQETDAGSEFLAVLADPMRGPLGFRTALVVAHPDDETIGCGAQLKRFSDITILHVTDGAPRNGADAAALGFAAPADYAAARRQELEAAMALAGVAPERLASLGWADQEASLHLPELAAQLADRLAGMDVVLTHAYEGGHPDHDAAAFAVHAARAMLARAGAAPLLIEMPLYRAGPEGRFAQSFVPRPDAVEVELRLDWDEQQLKQSMYAAHASQQEVLLLFRVDVERFRTAPQYDFSVLPNAGALHYERYDWGMTGARWLQLAKAAQAALPPGAAA